MGQVCVSDNENPSQFLTNPENTIQKHHHGQRRLEEWFFFICGVAVGL